jgi:hypothetical protein
MSVNRREVSRSLTVSGTLNCIPTELPRQCVFHVRRDWRWNAVDHAFSDIPVVFVVFCVVIRFGLREDCVAFLEIPEFLRCDATRPNCSSIRCREVLPRRRVTTSRRVSESRLWTIQSGPVLENLANSVVVVVLRSIGKVRIWKSPRRLDHMTNLWTLENDIRTH